MSSTINPGVISILDYIDKHFTLTQKEYITLGIIATLKKIPATQLAAYLQLQEKDRTRMWIGTLLEKQILVTHGEKKGTQYLLNPKLFKQAKLEISPSLKTMEPHVLEALILEDLKYNPKSKIGEIKKRLIGADEKEVQKSIYNLVKKGDLTTEGSLKYRTYGLAKKK